MQKLVIAFPLYRTVPVEWFFQWLQIQKEPVLGTVATEGIYVPMAMQNLVEMAFKHFGTDWDRLVVYEHDMIPPLDALNRMACYGDEHDIVGSVYFKHDEPHHVMAWMQVVPPTFSPLTAEVVKTMVEAPGLYEVDGVAMGFTSIRRQVFENWDPDIALWYPDMQPLVGHDLHFCHYARQQGFRVWLDSGIGCGHLTTMPIGYGHSQAALAAKAPQTWAEKLAGTGDPNGDPGSQDDSAANGSQGKWPCYHPGEDPQLLAMIPALKER